MNKNDAKNFFDSWLLIRTAPWARTVLNVSTALVKPGLAATRPKSNLVTDEAFSAMKELLCLDFLFKNPNPEVLRTYENVVSVTI